MATTYLAHLHIGIVPILVGIVVDTQVLTFAFRIVVYEGFGHRITDEVEDFFGLFNVG